MAVLPSQLIYLTIEGLDKALASLEDMTWFPDGQTARMAIEARRAIKLAKRDVERLETLLTKDPRFS